MNFSGNLALLKDIKKVKEEIEYVEAGNNIEFKKVGDTTLINVVEQPTFSDVYVDNKSVSTIIDEVITNTTAISEQTTKINKNIVDIQNNTDNINILVEQNKKQTNFIVDGFEIGKTYKQNDFSYFKINEIDNWFISKINDNLLNNIGDFDDQTKWLKTNTPDNPVDLENYYTKIETNNLLLPLENRLVSDEQNIKSNTIVIEKNTSDITKLKTLQYNIIDNVDVDTGKTFNGRKIYCRSFASMYWGGELILTNVHRIISLTAFFQKDGTDMIQLPLYQNVNCYFITYGINLQFKTSGLSKAQYMYGNVEYTKDSE